jgi:hypothetical protein
MKKIIALSMLAVSFAATTAFSQGYMVFSSGKSQVFDGFTTAATAAPSANVDVALFWAASGTTPTVDSFLTATPAGGNSTTTESYTVAQAWNAILNGQFTLAQSTAIGGSVIATSSATGVVKFNGGVSFDITGTTAGTSYAMYLVSWNAAFANPTLAAAGGSAVGWSAPFSYLVGVQTDQTLATPTVNGFSTFAPTPEPTTIALTGLGGLSLLLARRKK